MELKRIKRNNGAAPEMCSGLNGQHVNLKLFLS
jgi:hypothetical protein